MSSAVHYHLCRISSSLPPHYVHPIYIISPVWLPSISSSFSVVNRHYHYPTHHSSHHHIPPPLSSSSLYLCISRQVLVFEYLPTSTTQLVGKYLPVPVPYHTVMWGTVPSLLQVQNYFMLPTYRYLPYLRYVRYILICGNFVVFVYGT